MDAIAGLAFGIVVVNVIRQMGVTDDTAVAGEVLHSGILAGILMAFIYILTIPMGAQSLTVCALKWQTALSQPSSYHFWQSRSCDPGSYHYLCLLKTPIGWHQAALKLLYRCSWINWSHWTWARSTLFSLLCPTWDFPTIIRYSILPHADSSTSHFLQASGTVRKNIFTMTKKYNTAQSLNLGSISVRLFKTLPEQIAPVPSDKAGFVVEISFLSLNLNLGWTIPVINRLIIGLVLRKAEKECRRFTIKDLGILYLTKFLTFLLLYIQITLM